MSEYVNAVDFSTPEYFIDSVDSPGSPGKALELTKLIAENEKLYNGDVDELIESEDTFDIVLPYEGTVSPEELEEIETSILHAESYRDFFDRVHNLTPYVRAASALMLLANNAIPHQDNLYNSPIGNAVITDSDNSNRLFLPLVLSGNSSDISEAPLETNMVCFNVVENLGIKSDTWDSIEGWQLTPEGTYVSTDEEGAMIARYNTGPNDPYRYFASVSIRIKSNDSIDIHVGEDNIVVSNTHDAWRNYQLGGYISPTEFIKGELIVEYDESAMVEIDSIFLEGCRPTNWFERFLLIPIIYGNR